MIVRARAVVTMDGAPIENGAVAVSGDRIDDSPPGSSPSRAARLCPSAPAGSIVDVGTFSEISARYCGQEIVDLGEQVLLPGLINAHCHLDYTCLRGKIPRQKSFTDWIRAINAEKLKLSPKDYVISINEGFEEAKRFGTTTIANLTAFPELIRQLPDPPIRTWWFAELIDARSPDRANELVDSVIESLKSSQNYGLAPHALFTASKNLYQRCEEAGPNILLTTHLAESREEMEMFRDASGPLYEFMKSIGRPMEDCGKETPLEQFVGAPYASPARTGRALARWLVAHLNELTESDFELLEKMKTKFHVVHSPRSHEYFGHSRFPFKRLHALGFSVCLGTDSLASNESLSLFAEMRAFQRNEPAVSPDKIFEMVTVNAASALRQQNTLGRIRPGFRADLIAIPCTEDGDLFAEIVEFDGEINWMMVNGKP
ncbi:MAG TPA: amidohydrolase family protein [Verrucomicrobiae bacterium]|nr:amidohydrolase family protein [Verrucomicrobiae bacterium]